MQKILRNIFKATLTLLLGVCLAGCSDDFDLPEEQLIAGAPGTITIRFQNSKSSRNAASDNSETLIQTLTVCLYDSPDDDASPVFSRSFTPNKYNATTVVVGLSDELVEKLFTAATGYTCRMYAVANVSGLPEELTVNNIKNHLVNSDFFGLSVQTSFAMSGEGIVKYTPSNNPAEKGKAEGEGKLNRSAAKIRLNINLPEQIEITDDDGNVTETWKPQTADNAMRVLLNNGVQTGPVAATAGWEPEDDSAYYSSDDAEKESYRTFKNGLGNKDYPYGTEVPFYSYPNAWEEAVEESHKTTLTLMVPWRKEGTDQYRSLYYQVPVTPGTLNAIFGNYAYTINLNVGMLGSPNPDTSVEIDDVTYQVVDWSVEKLDMVINDYRYLVVNPEYYVANNEAEIVIPFYTSHPVEINDIEIEYERFNFYANGDGEKVTIDIPKTQIDASATRTDSICTYHIAQNRVTGQMSVVINHPLEIWTPVNSAGQEVKLTGNEDNTLSTVTGTIAKYEKPETKEAAYSPYTINVKLRHKDNPAFNSEIEIVQYPAMYITMDANPGGSYNTGSQRTWNSSGRYYKYTPTTSDYGYVYVNPTYTLVEDNANRNPNPEPFGYWTNDANLGNVRGLAGKNKNPNMYVITISQLESGTKYIIGDPRSNYINNSLTGTGNLQPTKDEDTYGDWSTTANVVYPSTSSAKRQLRYYYPTYEYDAGSKEAYMVAPKFRVASSWSVCASELSRENARRRCATYQEQGYPAGRWRLPTLGEFTYITQLSAQGKIPTLFNIDGNYLTAQGVYSVDKDGNVTKQDVTRSFVRAVYDEWYWENLTQYAMPKNQNGGYDYTLGDVKK